MRTLFKMIMLLFVLSGCEAFDFDMFFQSESLAETKFLDVIYENLDAYAEEDIDRVMATIDPDSPAYESTRTLTLQIFATYDLDYELKDVRVLDYDEETASVEFTQITRKISGPAFRDNEIQAINYLRRTDDGWKIYSTTINSIQYLD